MPPDTRRLSVYGVSSGRFNRGSPAETRPQAGKSRRSDFCVVAFHRVHLLNNPPRSRPVGRPNHFHLPFLLLGVAVEHRAEPRDGVGTHDAGGNDSFGVPFLALLADLALRGGARPQAKAAGANSRLGGSKYSRLLLQWSLSSPRPGSDCGCAPADHFVRPGVGEIPADRRCLCHFPVTVVI